MDGLLLIRSAPQGLIRQLGITLALSFPSAITSSAALPDPGSRDEVECQPLAFALTLSHLQHQKVRLAPPSPRKNINSAVAQGVAVSTLGGVATILSRSSSALQPLVRTPHRDSFLLPSSTTTLAAGTLTAITLFTLWQNYSQSVKDQERHQQYTECLDQSAQLQTYLQQQEQANTLLRKRLGELQALEGSLQQKIVQAAHQIHQVEASCKETIKQRLQEHHQKTTSMYGALMREITQQINNIAAEIKVSPKDPEFGEETVEQLRARIEKAQPYIIALEDRAKSLQTTLNAGLDVDTCAPVKDMFDKLGMMFINALSENQ